MDAALIKLGTSLRRRVRGKLSAGGNLISGTQLRALRCLGRITRGLVQRRNNTATELRDFGESVNLTAIVRGGDFLAYGNSQLRWEELPCCHHVRCVELVIERGKGRVTCSRARSRAERGIERGRIAIIEHGDVRVSRHSSGIAACCK